MCVKSECKISLKVQYILSVYSPFSDRVRLSVHNIPSPFLSLMGIFFFDLKFGHICFYILKPCPSWSSNRYSVFNSILHTFLHLVLITFSHHMSIPSQSTTSNDSRDRLNSNQPSQFLICPSVFHGDTTHPSNHLHLCSFKLQSNIN